MAIDTTATLSYSSVSAQKMRLVTDLIRGKSAQDAIDILTFEPTRAAQPLLKLLRSALANAEKNAGIAIDQLYVYYVTADEAPTRKWRRFGARGRFKPVLRRNSHLKVVLRQLEGEAAVAAAAAARPAPAAKTAPAPKAKAESKAKPKAKAKAKAKAK